VLINHFIKSLGETQGFFVSKKKNFISSFFYFSVFLFLREFYIRIKSTDDGKSKIYQHELFGRLMLSYR
jgi:hypothetical protein